jgi:hypothetical protein
MQSSSWWSPLRYTEAAIKRRTGMHNPSVVERYAIHHFELVIILQSNSNLRRPFELR